MSLYDDIQAIECEECRRLAIEELCQAVLKNAGEQEDVRRLVETVRSRLEPHKH